MIEEKILGCVEALLMAADGPLTVARLEILLAEDGAPDRKAIRTALSALQSDYAGRAVNLVEVAGGWRFRVGADYAGLLGKLWEERPPKLSRALLETLALIAYRQPISRGEIEEVRGVSVSSSIIKTLLEREWVRVVGYREVPGRPALFGTTSQFLDDLDLKRLEDLPSLPEIRDLDDLDAAADRLRAGASDEQEGEDDHASTTPEVPAADDADSPSDALH
ncbi:SMC-Scp complex subunit ScpB [Spectribacter hydrogenoxidans]|uniref:SMC-Scp complex subunit ScpB n=1 Tax=Spectribacter hydrogenoxidans TaxID=3075608 RepID=A0ABU3C1N6_9GAMM|nr:SMC-Scp complex subunit ScpB [Salinisphaera sp. W335]MDT0635452.1 SMC-Scp complex subunit ScpB [Salinisphaera sp. W335]